MKNNNLKISLVVGLLLIFLGVTAVAVTITLNDSQTAVQDTINLEVPKEQTGYAIKFQNGKITGVLSPEELEKEFENAIEAEPITQEELEEMENEKTN